jgi:hypothetical protein
MNNNYVWVQLNRIPLVNKIDYILLEDGRTIQLNDEIPMSPAGTVYKDVVSTNIVGGDFGGLYTDGIPGVFNVTITLDSYVLSHRYSWGYEVGDVLKIYGSQVGGTDGINDITITVTATDGDYGITEYDVVGKIPEYEVVISSFSSQEVNSDVLGYRIFNDIFGRTSFKRLSRKNTTYLTQPLSYTHTEIHVADAGVLTPPSVARKLPGVVLIDGERIEYYKTEGNVLKQLRRGTMGTGPRFILEPNTRVIDQGVNQTVPFNEQILVQNTLTTTSRNYTISTASTLVIGDGIKLSVGPPSDTIDIDVATAARDQAQLMANNVIDDDLAYDLNGDNVVDNLDVIAYNALINGTPLGFSPVSTSNYADMFVKTYTVPAVDQVSVYYGGRLLNKASTYHHDTTISYDSPEFNLLGNVATVFDLPVSTVDYLTVNDAYIVTATNEVWIYKNSVETDAINGFVWRGLKYVPPEFTINTSTQVITLNMLEPVVPGVKLTVVKKQFNRNTSWNDIVDDSTTLSLLESTSTQARFLQARPSELPDKYYYGGTTALTDSGIPITDRNGDPLLGL